MHAVPRAASVWQSDGLPGRQRLLHPAYGLNPTQDRRSRLRGLFVMQRLKTRPQFQAVMAGKTVSRTAHFALHSAAIDNSAAAENKTVHKPLFSHHAVWMGAMVPKRWARRAVTRSTIKRQIYAVSAHFECLLDTRAYVVRLRADFPRNQFVSATSEALKHAVRAELQILFANITRAVLPAGEG
jgi:ribonuclease P protein component